MSESERVTNWRSLQGALEWNFPSLRCRLALFISRELERDEVATQCNQRRDKSIKQGTIQEASAASSPLKSDRRSRHSITERETGTDLKSVTLFVLFSPFPPFFVRFFNCLFLQRIPSVRGRRMSRPVRRKTFSAFRHLFPQRAAEKPFRSRGGPEEFRLFSPVSVRPVFVLLATFGGERALVSTLTFLRYVA